MCNTRMKHRCQAPTVVNRVRTVAFEAGLCGSIKASSSVAAKTSFAILVLL